MAEQTPKEPTQDEINARIKEAREQAEQETADRFKEQLKELETLKAAQEAATKQEEYKKGIENLTPQIENLFEKQGGKKTSLNRFINEAGKDLIGKSDKEIAEAITTFKKNADNVDFFNNVKIDASGAIVDIEQKQAETTRYYPGTTIKKR